MERKRNCMEKIKIEHIETKFNNYRDKQDRQSLIKLWDSIKKYGQLRNIVVLKVKKEEYVLIEGFNILRCLKELKEQEVWAKVVEIKQDYEALKLKVLLNDLNFPIDYVELAKTINEIRDNMPYSDKLTDLPYTKAQIDKFRHIFNFDWDDFEQTKSNFVDPNQVDLFDAINECK